MTHKYEHLVSLDSGDTWTVYMRDTDSKGLPVTKPFICVEHEGRFIDADSLINTITEFKRKLALEHSMTCTVCRKYPCECQTYEHKTYGLFYCSQCQRELYGDIDDHQCEVTT